MDVVDSNGQSISRSKPVTRDSVDTLVEWQTGDLNDPNGRLRIMLKNACLYAIWCD